MRPVFAHVRPHLEVIPVFYYIAFMLPGLLLMLWAQSRVKSAYAKWSNVRNARGVTGAQAARSVLDANGLQDVAITSIPGNLTDHYDPRTRVLALSQGVYGVPSVAAIAIAAHEAGHAIQHARGYEWLKLRTAIVPAVNIGSNLGFMILFAGILLQITGLAWAGIILFGLSTLFALITLPVEFDASKRAKAALVQVGLVDGGVAGGQESKGVQQVLGAAAWTYVAGFATSVLTLLFYVMQVAGMSRRD
jgi:Zn-dependent membrane protease YugP